MIARATFRTMPAFSVIIPIIALMAMLPACAPREDNTLAPGSVTTGTPDAAANWPFWPVAMQVHPLTRWTVEDKTNRLMLEARIEFLDAQGNRSKAVGMMEVALVDARTMNDPDPARFVWTRDLINPAVNQQHFDLVTRTYLFRLEVQREHLPEQLELQAVFHSANGVVMQAARKVAALPAPRADSSSPASPHGAAPSPPAVSP